jgi:hypothetical protein
MIYVNGDSWSVRMPEATDDQIWPKLIADRLGESLINESVGCASNSRAHSCLENFLIAGNRPKLVVIALTGHHRWHLPSADLGYWNLGPEVAIQERTGNRDSYFHKWFWSNSYTEIDSVYRYYRTVWNMHELCKQFGVPSVFFQAWDEDLAKLNLTTSDNIGSYVLQYYEQTNIYYQQYTAGFEFFRNERKSWNYIEAPTFEKLLEPKHIDSSLHPNWLGHVEIANFVYQHITERGLV